MTPAKKSIKQRFYASTRLLSLMEDFRQMTNDCIRLGMEFEKEHHETPSRNKLSILSYAELRRRHRGGYSGYLLCANTKAAGILSARRKSIRRGFPTRTPYLSRAVLVSCYGFKIEDGNLLIHLDAETLESIPLNAHTKTVLSDPAMRVRSFTLSEESVSLCVSKDVKEITDREVTGTVGVDRNLRNLSAGNAQIVKYYDMTKLVDIGDNTRSIIRSLKRSDVRIRKGISSKYGKRRGDRTKQLLNLVSKNVVKDAKTNRQAIVFEEIANIRRLYRKGNGQGRSYRARMNSWPFYEIKRQIEYKAAWEGVPVVTLTKSETRGTTMDCPRCGERLQVPIRGDKEHYRQLWCEGCKRWRDRDLVAVLNISRRGWLRFDHSSKEGEANEAVKGNAEHEGEPLILRVDASKLRHTAKQMQ
jgi:putative transposase